MEWPSAIAAGWHPVAAIEQLSRGQPLAAKLLGQSIVLFRGETDVAALLDRCPHRGVPLSLGKLREGTIACPYHGWRFAGDGHCVEVPGATQCPAVSATVLPVKVAAGLVWVNLTDQPPPFPELPGAMFDDNLDRFWWQLEPSRAGLLDALENHLDPAHPHQLHPWLVRPPHRRRRTAVEIRTGPWGGEAIYVEQRRNLALLSSVMEGRRARSIGRLWPPTIGEVRLESARGAMLSIAVVFSPVDVGLTRPWAHFASTKAFVPAWLKQVALKAFHMPVLREDQRMLRIQDEARTGERYQIGPLDVLARAIWRHANGQDCPEEHDVTELFL